MELTKYIDFERSTVFSFKSTCDFISSQRKKANNVSSLAVDIWKAETRGTLIKCSAKRMPEKSF